MQNDNHITITLCLEYVLYLSVCHLISKINTYTLPISNSMVMFPIYKVYAMQT